MQSLATIAERLLADADSTAKPLSYYAIYQKYFTPLAEERLAILEFGTSKGDSTKISATFFRNSRILTLDLHPRDVDFSGFENVRSVQADQTDGPALERIRLEFAHGGLLAKRIVSHDHGMVGFVKFLVDETAGKDRYPPVSASRAAPQVIEYLHVYPGLAILKKCP